MLGLGFILVGSGKCQIDCVEERWKKNKQRRHLQGLTESPESIAQSPKIVEVEKRPDRNIRDRE
jgi:hypothetical protein